MARAPVAFERKPSTKPGDDHGSVRIDRSQFVKPLDRMRAVQAAVVEATQHQPELPRATATMVSIRGTPKGLIMTYDVGGRTVVIEAKRKDMKQAAARGELDAFMADLVAKAL